MTVDKDQNTQKSRKRQRLQGPAGRVSVGTDYDLEFWKKREAATIFSSWRYVGWRVVSA